jgi:hypothetical protein
MRLRAGCIRLSLEQPRQAGSMPNLRQLPACRSGQACSISQSENLEIKSDKSEHGNGDLTSARTVSAGPPYNLPGLLYDRAIEWLNGTKWYKQ